MFIVSNKEILWSWSFCKSISAPSAMRAAWT